ncbi:MAG: adenylosuccinate lyase [Actinomyces urogenitalis]|jgi:adenylosuccinate lyase|uniref:Adenylosuccinate lyase n=5 Tax=root TaxID=1 RepID=C0W4I7_9ACTO|nr:adenylosuccinate lyase [Actinomyces urogenitalis]EEH66321.1 adenylosuccinate lyase [Actinomyces urogenitalis DSM 15434]KGF02596.1 adenylosuccinate lyase [Actinomyces urogenitalis S6-C4]MBS5976784.1 adenylosuccinate lyase [Actinomyces urogenitalis]MBS6071991.1 adenylosuccinate lyase [Actinomyces urogenitalis]MDK8237139.1 adenylosuccinate lyase [Actinomyces urogenitalis]
MVDLSSLTPPIALGPLDGRYRSVTAPLTNYLSEAALNRARLQVEVEWLIHLTEGHVLPGAPVLSAAEKAYLRDVVASFGADEIAELAEIEAVTRHDVKAVEYLLKRRLDAAPAALGEDTVLPTVHEIVHIFCTSEDINNLSYALTIRDAVQDVWLPAARGLVEDLTALAHDNADAAMLSRTHGQAATPTTLGKEMAVLAWRLSRQVRRVEATEYLGKINGATGTYGAHVVSVPGADWEAVSRSFVEGLGLTWNPLTTQIESHDWQAELYSDVARFNRIAHNLATDVWTYISLGYFHQRLSAQGSTGSSTMPHKVNPIRFENGEANLEISCSLLDTLAATLVTSRLQRDLTDSTTQRNIGVAFGHSLLALDNIRRGLAGLDVDRSRLAEDLDATWEVLGEPVQQAMRAASVAGATGMADPYERLKELTRGKKVTPEAMREFIAGLGMPADVEARLLALTPASYTGLAEQLVSHLEG